MSKFQNPNSKLKNPLSSTPPLLFVNRKPISTVDGQVRLVVGILVLSSVALALFVNLAWLGLTAFVGLALVSAGFSGVCPMEFFVSHCPWNRKGARA